MEAEAVVVGKGCIHKVACDGGTVSKVGSDQLDR